MSACRHRASLRASRPGPRPLASAMSHVIAGTVAGCGGSRRTPRALFPLRLNFSVSSSFIVRSVPTGLCSFAWLFPWCPGWWREGRCAPGALASASGADGATRTGQRPALAGRWAFRRPGTHPCRRGATFSPAPPTVGPVCPASRGRAPVFQEQVTSLRVQAPGCQDVLLPAPGLLCSRRHQPSSPRGAGGGGEGAGAGSSAPASSSPRLPGAGGARGEGGELSRTPWPGRGHAAPTSRCPGRFLRTQPSSPAGPWAGKSVRLRGTDGVLSPWPRGGVRGPVRCVCSATGQASTDPGPVAGSGWCVVSLWPPGTPQ